MEVLNIVELLDDFKVGLNVLILGIGLQQLLELIHNAKDVDAPEFFI